MFLTYSTVFSRWEAEEIIFPGKRTNKSEAKMNNETTQSKTQLRGEIMRKAFVKTIHITLIATAALLATGCLNNQDVMDEVATSSLVANSAEKKSFEASQELWQKSKPPAYSFQLSRNCFCFPYGRMEVFVDNDQVVKVDTISGVEGPYDLESFHNAPNMDDVFHQIESFLDNPDYEVKARYNEKLGYPTSVQIHHTLNYTDTDADFQIASFRPDK